MAKITVEQYAVGVLGLSVIRHWYRDGTFNDARVNELKEVLESGDRFPWNLEINPQERQLLEGYAEWAATYDGPNPLIAAEERVVHPVLRRLVAPGTVALDAACGTGRHAAFLDSLGAVCTGVDQSSEMLRVASAKVSRCRFEQGTLDRLPFDDDRFDVAIVSLALCHLTDPTGAVAELSRVVRRGG